MVRSSFSEGKLEFVEVTSQLGGVCRLRNPWHDKPIRFFQDGEQFRLEASELLSIPTKRGDRFHLLP